MKILWFLCLFIFCLQAHAEDQGQLHSFARGLDKTLRSVHSSDSRPCPEPSLALASAQKATFKKKKVTVLSAADAQTLFNDLKNQSDIPYAFSLAGCEQRAHEMSRLMLLKGVTPLKAFVSVDESKEPRLEIPHPKKPGEVIRWKYHVAPLVMVEENGKQVPYIIDPSMEKSAVPLEQWRAHMTAHDKKMKVRTDITVATQVYKGSPLKYDFKDQEFNEHIKNTLKQFKEYEQDDFGEEKYEESVTGFPW